MPEPLPETRSLEKKTRNTNIQTHKDTYKNCYAGPVLSPLTLDKKAKGKEKHPFEQHEEKQET